MASEGRAKVATVHVKLLNSACLLPNSIVYWSLICLVACTIRVVNLPVLGDATHV